MFSASEIRCNLCGHNKADKDRKTGKGYQPHKCPNCGKVLPEDFETLYFNSGLSTQNLHSIIQSQVQSSSLCAVSRISRLAYNTLIFLIGQLFKNLRTKCQLEQDRK